MWQVYAKVKNVWVAVGGPMSEHDAYQRVAEMVHSGKWVEPHCVPLN